MNNLPRFYQLLPYNNGLFVDRKYAYELSADPVKLGDCDYCPICKGSVSSIKWLPPQRITLSSSNPKTWGDFVFGPTYHPFVSAKFKRIYEHERLKGITKFYPPAEIVKFGKKKAKDFSEDLPVYHLIEVVLGNGRIDYKASGIVPQNPLKCDYCQVGVVKKWDREILEKDSWKGDDIFTPWGGSGILVSERFKNALIKYGIKNYLLYPAEEWWYRYPSKYSTDQPKSFWAKGYIQN